MKILFLSKRLYMSHDLLRDSYGRFYEIPYYMAKSGHQVKLICLGYRKVSGPDTRETRDLSICSFQLGINPLLGFIEHYYRLDKITAGFLPDVIIAASDCYHIMLGQRLARRHGITFVADLYDNFEAYPASRLPGILPAFYRSLSAARAITVISSPLQQYLHNRMQSHPPLHIVGNAVSDMFLETRDKDRARQQFGFKKDAIYLGTAGSLQQGRGIEVLIQAFQQLASTDKRLHLVLAGPRDKKSGIPDNPNIHYLGQLEHARIPELFTALDVGVVCVRDDTFGRYCFPQKLYEMVACGLPIVAARVGVMVKLLESQGQCLYRPDNCEDLQMALRYQIQHRKLLSSTVPTWEMQARKFEEIIDTGLHLPVG